MVYHFTFQVPIYGMHEGASCPNLLVLGPPSKIGADGVHIPYIFQFHATISFWTQNYTPPHPTPKGLGLGSNTSKGPTLL